MWIKLFKRSGDKAPTPVLSGIAFSNLIQGKSVFGLGYIGDDTCIA